jgi:uncharacterized protein YbaP (TraB family)
MLWRIEPSGLRILGTCHTLQATDYPISLAYEAAYVSSSRVVLEADARAPELRTMGLSAGDDALVHQDPELYRQVQAALVAFGQDVSSLPSSKPWHAGLRLGLGLLQREGFDYRYSLDGYLRGRAEGDGKAIEFLETPTDQLRCFEIQPLATQLHWLRFALAHEAWGVQQIHRIVNGWRRSDTVEVASALSDYLNLLPDLYRCLIIGRNHAWLRRIETIAGEAPSTLVCVGALHCVGEFGLPELLKGKGWEPRVEDAQR